MTSLDREGLAIGVVAVLVVALLAAGAYVLFETPAPADGSLDVAFDTSRTARPPPAPAVSDSTLEFAYPGEEGRTVLELLKREHEVRLDSELMLFGSIVLAIDTFVATQNQYWIYYRDSVRGDRSPEVCTTVTGETIHWVLTQRR